jgi:hypothetical protein
MMDSTPSRDGRPFLSFLPPARWLAEYRAAWLPADADGLGEKVGSLDRVVTLDSLLGGERSQRRSQQHS